MKRGLILSLITTCVALAIVGGGKMLRRTPPPSLPPVFRYERLPKEFGVALDRARADADRAPPQAEPVRKLAHLYQANGLLDEARVCYQRVARLGTGLDARDHYALADIALNLGDLETAKTELAVTIEHEPNYMPARIRLGEVLFKTGDCEGAERVYVSALQLQADQPQAVVGLARCELQRGDDDAAVARLERLVTNRPESAAAAGLLAQLLDRRGQTDRAAAIAQASRQHPEPIPADPWIESLLKECFDRQRLTLKFEEYLMAGQIDEALPLLSRVEELDPGSWIPHLLRGWTQARASHHVEAVKEYSAALSKGGDPEKILPLLERTFIAANLLSDAEKILAKYAAQLPDSIPILTAYSDIAMKRGDQALAQQLLTRLLAKEPYLYSANLDLSKIYWTAGNRDAAVECLLRIVKVFPVDVASRGLLGQYYLEKADPVSAIPPLQQALPHAAANSPAHERLAAMLHQAYVQAAAAAMKRGEISIAAEGFGKAVAVKPGDVEAAAAEAAAWTQLKQFRRAADALARLARLQPRNPTIPLSLGDVLYQAGEHEQAREAWTRAQQLTAETDTELRQALHARLVEPITDRTFE